MSFVQINPGINQPKKLICGPGLPDIYRGEWVEITDSSILSQVQSIATNHDIAITVAASPSGPLSPGDETQATRQYVLDQLATLPYIYAPIQLPPRSYSRRPVAVGGNASGAGASANSQSAAGGYTARVPHTVAVDCADIRLVFTNFYVNTNVADVDNANTLTVKAAVEVGGTIYPVTFNGARTGTVDGGGVLISDPLAVEIAAGTQIYSRTYVSGTTYYPNKTLYLVGTGNGGRVAGDSTYSGTIADSGAYAYSPAALIGTPTAAKAGVLIVGDSIGEGLYDGDPNSRGSVLADGSSGGGYLSRGLRGVVGAINVAQASERSSTFIAQGEHVRRLALAQFCTHMLSEYAVNDILQGDSLATVQANTIAVWNLGVRRGLKVAQTTITPVSTSTDNFATVANQTAGSHESVRLAFNAWLRDGAPMVNGAAVATGTSGGTVARTNYYDATNTLTSKASGPMHPLTAVLEVADTAESARDSGKWKSTGRVVTDAAMTSAGYGLTSSTAAFTSADKGAGVVVAGAGTSGADLQTFIQSVSSATQAQLAVPAGTTVSAARAVIAPPSFDGTHPLATMVTKLANALPTGWLSL